MNGHALGFARLRSNYPLDKTGGPVGFCFSLWLSDQLDKKHPSKVCVLVLSLGWHDWGTNKLILRSIILCSCLTVEYILHGFYKRFYFT